MSFVQGFFVIFFQVRSLSWITPRKVFLKGNNLIPFHTSKKKRKQINQLTPRVSLWNCKFKFRGDNNSRKPPVSNFALKSWQVRLACRRGYRPLGGHTFGRCSLNGAWCSMAGWAGWSTGTGGLAHGRSGHWSEQSVAWITTLPGNLT